jgi:hypothetical protein
MCVLMCVLMCILMCVLMCDDVIVDGSPFDTQNKFARHPW